MEPCIASVYRPIRQDGFAIEPKLKEQTYFKMEPACRRTYTIRYSNKLIRRHFWQSIMINNGPASRGLVSDDITGRWLGAGLSVDAV